MGKEITEKDIKDVVNYLLMSNNISEKNLELLKKELQKKKYIFLRSKKKTMEFLLKEEEEKIIAYTSWMGKLNRNKEEFSEEVIPVLEKAYDSFMNPLICNPIGRLLWAPEIGEMIKKIRGGEG